MFQRRGAAVGRIDGDRFGPSASTGLAMARGFFFPFRSGHYPDVDLSFFGEIFHEMFIINDRKEFVTIAICIIQQNDIVIIQTIYLEDYKDLL